jgi:iron complex transport system substrate-binding protein
MRAREKTSGRKEKGLPGKQVARIVSLAPNVTAILCAIGARKSLVGVTRWCADVAKVGKLPRLGDCWKVESLEAIAALQPTLIVGSVPFHPEAVGKLLTIPAQFLALNPRSLRDIERDIETLARLSGQTRNGQRLISRMRTEFGRLQKLGTKLFKESARRPRIYAEAWPNPRISSPPWVRELIEICGGEMVVKAGARVSDEEVAEARPDIILLAWTATGKRANVRTALDNTKWKDVPAVRTRQVFVIQDELLNTPGPPLITGAHEIFRITKSFMERSQA